MTQLSGNSFLSNGMMSYISMQAKNFFCGGDFYEKFPQIVSGKKIYTQEDSVKFGGISKIGADIVSIIKPRRHAKEFLELTFKDDFFSELLFILKSPILMHAVKVQYNKLKEKGVLNFDLEASASELLRKIESMDNANVLNMDLSDEKLTVLNSVLLAVEKTCSNINKLIKKINSRRRGSDSSQYLNLLEEFFGIPAGKLNSFFQINKSLLKKNKVDFTAVHFTNDASNPLKESVFTHLCGFMKDIYFADGSMLKKSSIIYNSATIKDTYSMIGSSYPKYIGDASVASPESPEVRIFPLVSNGVVFSDVMKLFTGSHKGGDDLFNGYSKSEVVTPLIDKLKELGLYQHIEKRRRFVLDSAVLGESVGLTTFTLKGVGAPLSHTVTAHV